MKLMIVDDNPRIRSVIKNIFHENNFQIVEFGNGEEAVNNVLTVSPDWITMDIKMPRMDGITAAKKIMDLIPTMKIIIVSEYLDSMIDGTTNDNPAFSFVKKENLSLLKSIIQ